MMHAFRVEKKKYGANEELVHKVQIWGKNSEIKET